MVGMFIPGAKSKFGPAVREAFSSYLSALGFILKEIDWYIFVAESPHCSVMIIFDPICVAIKVKPLSSDPHVEYTEYGLCTVLQVLAPEREFRVRLLNRPEQIPPEVDRQIRALVQYCRPILEGDSSEWAKIDARVEAGRRSQPVRTQEETEEERVHRMHQDALDAHSRFDYVRMLISYGALRSLGEQLTPEEERLYEEARAWDRGEIEAPAPP